MTKPTNPVNDARRIFERLAKGGDVSRDKLLRLCNKSHNRLGVALARLWNDGHDVQCVKAGQSVWYRMPGKAAVASDPTRRGID